MKKKLFLSILVSLFPVVALAISAAPISKVPPQKTLKPPPSFSMQKKNELISPLQKEITVLHTLLDELFKANKDVKDEFNRKVDEKFHEMALKIAQEVFGHVKSNNAMESKNKWEGNATSALLDEMNNKGSKANDLLQGKSINLSNPSDVTAVKNNFGMFDAIKKFFNRSPAKPFKKYITDAPEFNEEQRAIMTKIDQRLGQLWSKLATDQSMKGYSTSMARLLEIEMIYYMARNLGSMTTDLYYIADEHMCHGDIVDTFRRFTDFMLVNNLKWAHHELLKFHGQLSCMSSKQAWALDVLAYDGYAHAVASYLKAINKLPKDINFSSSSRLSSEEGLKLMDVSDPIIADFDGSVFNPFLALHDLNKFRGDMSFLWLGTKAPELNDVVYRKGQKLYDFGIYLYDLSNASLTYVKVEEGGGVADKIDGDYFLNAANDPKFTPEKYTPFFMEKKFLFDTVCSMAVSSGSEGLQFSGLMQSIISPVELGTGAMSFLQTAAQGKPDTTLCGAMGSSSGSGGGITCSVGNSGPQRPSKCQSMPFFKAPPSAGGSVAINGTAPVPKDFGMDIRQMWDNTVCSNLLGGGGDGSFLSAREVTEEKITETNSHTEQMKEDEKKKKDQAVKEGMDKLTENKDEIFDAIDKGLEAEGAPKLTQSQKDAFMAGAEQAMLDAEISALPSTASGGGIAGVGGITSGIGADTSIKMSPMSLPGGVYYQSATPGELWAHEAIHAGMRSIGINDTVRVNVDGKYGSYSGRFGHYVTGSTGFGYSNKMPNINDASSEMCTGYHAMAFMGGATCMSMPEFEYKEWCSNPDVDCLPPTQSALNSDTDEFVKDIGFGDLLANIAPVDPVNPLTGEGPLPFDDGLCSIGSGPKISNKFLLQTFITDPNPTEQIIQDKIQHLPNFMINVISDKYKLQQKVMGNTLNEMEKR